jgi:hypothetical protein
MKKLGVWLVVLLVGVLVGSVFLGKCGAGLKAPQVSQEQPEKFGATAAPPALDVSDWYLDFSNNTGCASDTNSGTSATCGATNVGPLLHVAQLYARWGSHSPTLNPGVGTTIHVLSSQPSGAWSTDPWGVFAPNAPAGLIAIIGTPQVVQNCVDGAVTAISRTAAGNDWKIAAGTCTYVAGQLAFNSTISGSSYAWIDSVSAGTATLTSPQNGSTIATISNNVNATGASNGTAWTTGGGDAIQLSTPPIIYMDKLQSNVGSTLTVPGTSGLTWIQNIEFGDSSGTNKSTIVIYPEGPWVCTLCRSDAIVYITGDPSASSTQTITANVLQPWFQAGGGMTGTVRVVAGAFATTLNSTSIAALQSQIWGDTIFHGLMVMQNGWTQFRDVHILSTAETEPGASIALEPGSQAPAVWGAGTLEAIQSSSVVNRTGSTWALNALVSAFRLTASASTTGCAPIDGGAGAPPCGIALTAANIDANGSLSDPLSGARFTN